MSQTLGYPNAKSCYTAKHLKDHIHQWLVILILYWNTLVFQLLKFYCFDKLWVLFPFPVFLHTNVAIFLQSVYFQNQKLTLSCVGKLWNVSKCSNRHFNFFALYFIENKCFPSYILFCLKGNNYYFCNIISSKHDGPIFIEN